MSTTVGRESGPEDILAYWKRMRLNYPGWLSISFSIAKTLFYKDEHGLSYDLEKISSLPNTNTKLLLLGEWAWRIELRGEAIWINDYIKIENTLRDLCPFEGLQTFLGNPCTFLNAESTHTLSLKEAWIRSALLLLRFYREDGNFEIVQVIITFLAPIISRDDASRNQLMYENVMSSLVNLDLKEALLQLKQWDGASITNEWNLRKAAILLEIGLISEAHEISNQIASVVQHLDESDLRAKSMEGTAILQAGINRHVNLFVQRLDSTEYDRLDELAVTNCNPFKLLKEFDNILNSIEFIPPGNISKRFDPFSYTRTFRFGNGTEDQLRVDAYRIQRLRERLCCPIRSGKVWIPSKDTFPTFIEALLPVLPQTIFSYMMRFGTSELIEKIFNRVLVNHMTSEALGGLPGKLNKAAEQAFDLIKNRQYVSDHQYEYFQRVLQNAIQTLSQISFRMQNIEIEAFWDLLNRVLKEESILTPDLYQTISIAQGRIVYLMFSKSEPNLLTKALQVHIPYVSEDTLGVNPTLGNTLELIKPRIFQFIEEETDFRKAIGHLFEIEKSKSIFEGSVAILRLTKIYNLKLLTKSEEDLLANALWKRRNGATRSVAEELFTLSSLLFIPKPLDQDTEELVKSHFLKRDFPKAVQPNGSISGLVINTGSYLRDLIGTIKLGNITRNEEILSIQWSTEEVMALFQKLKLWFANDKRIFSKEVSGSLAGTFLRNASETIPRTVVHFISVFLLPKLKNTVMFGELVEFILEIERLGFDTIEARALLCDGSPENIDSISDEIETALSRHERAENSSNAIISWMTLRKELALPEIPEQTIDSLIISLHVTGFDGWEYVMSVLIAIIKMEPEYLTKNRMRLISQLLASLADRIRVPEGNPWHSLTEQRMPDEVLRSPDWIAQVSELVGLLVIISDSRGYQMHKALFDWNDFIDSCHYPEAKIRKKIGMSMR